MPEEFADAYRQAYEQALAEHAAAQAGAHRADGDADADDADDALDRTDELEPVPAQEAGQEIGQEIGQEPAGEPDVGLGALLGGGPDEGERPVGAHADWDAVDEPAPEGRPGWTEYSVESAWDRFRISRAFVPALLALFALVLVGGAYGVGRIFAAGVQEAQPTASETARATVPASQPGVKVPGSGRHTASGRPKQAQQQASEHAWHGKVHAVSVGSASAACVAPPAVDAAGHRVTYQPANAVDGVRDTAWRCPGKAIGRELVVHLPHPVTVGEVGLVPGYAKTDPASHVDRYAQNNRITRLRWILGHGVSVVQRLDGSAHDRSMRTIRVPRTRTDRIVLQVLAVQRGPFDTTCVSEVRVAATA